MQAKSGIATAAAIERTSCMRLRKSPLFYRGDDRADRRSRKEHDIQHAVKIHSVCGSGAFDRHEPGVSAAPGEPPDNIRRREFKPRRRIYTEIRDRLCVLSRKADAPYDVVKYHSDGVYRRLSADIEPRLAVRAAALKHFADEVYNGQDQCERNICLIYPARQAQKHRRDSPLPRLFAFERRKQHCERRKQHGKEISVRGKAVKESLGHSGI